MKKFLLTLAIALQAFLFSFAQHDSLKISLLTCEPGASIYELYGHTAIRVQDFIQGRDLVFNYGLFDFNTPHFIWRFCLGKTDYLLGVQRLGSFMDEYDERGSRVWSQQLNLTPEENALLYGLLLENCLPENRVYRYNFLYGNCATMAIDKIEQSISGTVLYDDPKEDESFRTILDAHTGIKPWSQFAVNLVVGAEADRQLECRQEAFAPQRLMDLASSAVICDNDGTRRPLVLPAVMLVHPDHGVDFGKCLISPVQAMWLLLLATLFVCLLGWYRERLFFAFDCILFGIQGLAGLVIAFMFFLSSHPAVDSNWIIMILNPLPLVFLPFTAHNLRHGHPDMFLAVLFVISASFAMLSPVMPQDIHPAVVLFSACLALRSFSSSLFLLRKYYRDTGHRHKRGSITVRSVLLAMTVLPISQNASSQTSVPKPRLIVGITVDQFDSDCMLNLLSRFQNGGIRKMWYNGYSFSNVTFDFENPDCASAVASLYSGAVPYDNGIMAGRWMSRNSLNVIQVVDDSNFPGDGTRELTSPARLQASNLSDVIKLSTGGRSKVISVAIEREAAVLSAGHEADLAVWMNPTDCRWCTSDYYGGLPAWIQSECNAEITPVNWEPLHPSGYYVQKSDYESYRQFSHNIRSTDQAAFRSSPMANSRTIDLAIKSVGEMGLGMDNNTDLLAITLFGGNFEGQPSSLWSLEQQDIYLRLDQDIARLMDAIDTRFGGKGDVLYFLTSTGYTVPWIPDLNGSRIPSGTVSMERITALLNLYLSAKYDCSNLAGTYYGNHIYLNHKAIEDAGLELHRVLDSCVDLLVQASGIRNVVLLRDLQSVIPDRQSLAMRNSLSPSFSGDIIVQSLPGWTISDEAHGLDIFGKPYENAFPMVIYGSGIRSQVNHDPVSASVLAPTIAAIARAGMPNACVTAPITGIGK